jgi:hypothetical protein
VNNSLVSQLKNGIYVIHWKKSQGGGSSLAAVGTQTDGKKWIAPINWTSPRMESANFSSPWKFVSSVNLVAESPLQYGSHEVNHD